MNFLDLGVLVFIALSAVFAFARGFVREALSIAAWIGAAVLTLYGYHYVFRIANAVLHNPLLSEVIAIGGTFIVSLIALTIATGLVARLVRTSTLSPIDRSLGLIFGVARGLVLVSLAYLLLDISVPPHDRPGWIRHAKTRPYLAEGAALLRSVLPPGFRLDGGDSMNGTDRAASAAREAGRAMRAYATPKAPLPPNEAVLPRYPTGDRRQMNRIVDTQQ